MQKYESDLHIGAFKLVGAKRRATELVSNFPYLPETPDIRRYEVPVKRRCTGLGSNDEHQG